MSRVPPMSARRRAQQALRREVCEIVRQAAGGVCWLAPVITEVRCGLLPGRSQLEVDELRGGAYRSTEWLDPTRCRLICPRHHDHKTVHKLAVLARLEAHEVHRPWPVTSPPPTTHELFPQ